MKKFLLVILALSINSVFLLAQDSTNDENELRSIIQKLGNVWISINGADIFDDITSSNYCNYSSNGTIDKVNVLKTISDTTKNGYYTEVSHTIIKLQIKGTIAYEYGKQTMKTKSGEVNTIDIFNVFHHEQDGWKLYANYPVEDLEKIWN